MDPILTSLPRFPSPKLKITIPRLMTVRLLLLSDRNLISSCGSGAARAAGLGIRKRATLKYVLFMWFSFGDVLILVCVSATIQMIVDERIVAKALHMLRTTMMMPKHQ
jgi:hypothetical protein